MFVDDVTTDGSSRMNSDVCRAILPAHSQLDAAELIIWCFTVQMDNNPKHTVKTSQELLKVKKWSILQWPCQSHVPSPIEHVFHLLETKLEAERPTNEQQLKEAAVKVW